MCRPGKHDLSKQRGADSGNSRLPRLKGEMGNQILFLPKETIERYTNIQMMFSQ